MYTVRDSEVVSKGCHHASMVSNSNDWSVGPIPALATGFPVRNHIAEAGLCFRVVGYLILVRNSDAAVVRLAGQEECPA